MESLLKICWSIEQCSDTKKGHEVSLLTDMSFLKWRYTAKANCQLLVERVLFFEGKKAFYKKIRRDFLFFKRKKAFYKKIRRDFLFFKRKKVFYKKF